MNEQVDTATLRALARRAQAEAWRIDIGDPDDRLGYDITTDAGDYVCRVESYDDAAFIVAAKSTVDNLCDELDRLRAATGRETLSSIVQDTCKPPTAATRSASAPSTQRVV